MFQRKYKFIIPLLFLGFSIHAATSLDGTVGIKGDFQKAETPNLHFEGFAAGQLNIGTSLVIRGEVSARPQEEYQNDDKIEKTDKFSLNELSGTFVLPHSFGVSFFSVYRGGFEPIGSNQFLQRLFSIDPYSSMLTENWLGSTGASVHNFHASVGGAYTLKLKSLPIAARFYLYRNNESTKKHYQPNTELRLGMAFKYLKLDVSGGVSAPIYQKDSAGKKVLLLIDDVTLHTGMDMLLGSKNFASLFVEAGIDKLHIDGSGVKDFDIESLFLLVEPRLNLGLATLSVSAFSFPDDVTRDLLFITYDRTTPALVKSTFGFSAGLVTRDFNVFNRSVKAGVNVSLYKNGIDLEELTKLYDMKDDATVKVSPFVTCDIAGGELKTMVQVNASKLKDSVKESLMVNAGYKISF